MTGPIYESVRVRAEHGKVFVVAMIRCAGGCGRTIEVKVLESEWHAWKDGDKLIQKAMPSLNADQRELLLSGLCGKCFDSVMSED